MPLTCTDLCRRKGFRADCWQIIFSVFNERGVVLKPEELSRMRKVCREWRILLREIPGMVLLYERKPAMFFNAEALVERSSNVKCSRVITPYLVVRPGGRGAPLSRCRGHIYATNAMVSIPNLKNYRTAIASCRTRIYRSRVVNMYVRSFGGLNEMWGRNEKALGQTVLDISRELLHLTRTRVTDMVSVFYRVTALEPSARLILSIAITLSTLVGREIVGREKEGMTVVVHARAGGRLISMQLPSGDLSAREDVRADFRRFWGSIKRGEGVYFVMSLCRRVPPAFDPFTRGDGIKLPAPFGSMIPK